MSTSRKVASATGDDRAAVGAFEKGKIDTGDSKDRARPPTNGGEGAAVGASAKETKKTQGLCTQTKILVIWTQNCSRRRPRRSYKGCVDKGQKCQGGMDT